MNNLSLGLSQAKAPDENLRIGNKKRDPIYITIEN
jgi:hypothetical protein